MNHFSFDLSLVALIPALFLCVYVYLKDRIEREPIGLLGLLFGAGAVAYVPIWFAQKFLVEMIDKLFANDISFSAEGRISYTSANMEMLHIVIVSFLGYSVLQILVKWCVLFFVTHKNKNFNYLFDGIVYSVFLSFGYAVAENIHFVLRNDWELFGAKLLTSIPCHLFIGILMGYYYTMWRSRFLVNVIEEKMIEKDIVKEDNIRSSAGWLICSLVIPIVINSGYLIAGSIKTDLITVAFFSAVFMLYGVSFITIQELASKDCDSKRYLCRVIAKGHPEISQETIEKIILEDSVNVNEEVVAE